MTRIFLSAFAVLSIVSLAPSIALADVFGYELTVNTSSLAGTVGNLEFQFTPGDPAPLPAIGAIESFSGGRFVGTPSTYGLVSGILPATVTFSNSTASDFYQSFIYGQSLTFRALIYETLSPTGGGNQFGFSMFDNVALPNPVLTTDLVNGFAFTAGFPSQGFAVSTNYSPEVAAVFFTPEPGSGLLLLLGALGVFAVGSRRPAE